MRSLLIYLSAFIAISTSSNAQSLKGYWYGGLTSDTSNVYVIDVDYLLNIKEHSGSFVSGRAYVYRSAYAIEGILDFIGEVNQNHVTVTELTIVNSRIPINNRYLCIKNLDLILSSEADNDKLKGSWDGNIESGERCIPGKAVLKRLKKEDYSSIPPAVLTSILDASPVTFLGTTLNYPLVVNVKSRNIKLEINDYLKPDNDTVSVYYNRKSIIKNLNIETQPYFKSLRLARDQNMHEIIMYAENLGAIPPNTCVLTVDDGVSRHTVSIRSTKETSVVIYLRYNNSKP